MEYMTQEEVRKRLPVIHLERNKGDAGRVFIVGGSRGMTGAVCMAANAAVKTGSGLVTVGIPASLNGTIEIKLTEPMSLPLPETEGVFAPEAAGEALAFAQNCQCVVIGPGARNGAGTRALTEAFLEQYQGTLLLDADGINVLEQNIDKLKIKKCRVILTPHPGEMSRLTGLSISEIQADREQIALRFAKEYGVTVVLKGSQTVVTDGEALLINPTGNPGMATGGTGDVLSGMIASLAGQGLTPLDACLCGAYLHGLSGDFAAEDQTHFCLRATDLITYLPLAFQKVLK